MLLPSTSKPSLHSENHEVEAYDAREDGSERETEHSIADSNSQIEEPDFSAAYTIPTTLRVAILCRHWNGFEGSCARLDKCNFKHSTQFSVKEPCRNWRQTGSCQYGQNCNYFHPIEKPYAARSEEGSTKSSPRPLAHPLPGKKKQNETSAISNHTTSREDLLAGASGGRWSHNRDSRSTMSGGSHSHGGLASPRDHEDGNSKWARARNERNERMLEKNKLNNRSYEDREGSRSHSARDNSLTMGTSTSNNSSSQNVTMHPVPHRHSVSAGDHASRESESHDFAEDTASRRESFYGGDGSRPGSTSSSMSRDTSSAYNALFSITINNAIYNASLPNNTNSNHSPRQSFSAPSPLSPRSSPISQQYLKSSLSGSSSETSLHNSTNNLKNSQHSKSNSSHYSSGSLERSGGNHNNRKDSRLNNNNVNTNTSSHSRSDSESNIPLFRSSNSNGNSRTERNVSNFSNSTGGINNATNAMGPEPVKKTLRQNPLYKKNAKQNKPLVLGFGR